MTKYLAGHAAGDEGLGAVQHPFVAVLAGGGLEIGDVGAAGRLGNSQGRADIAGEDRGKDAPFEFFRSEQGDRSRRDIAGAERRAHAGRAAFAEFLGDRRAHEAVVEPQPAIGLVDAETEHAERAGLPVQFPRNGAGLVPFVCEGPNLGVDEPRETVPERALLVGLERVLHDRIPVKCDARRKASGFRRQFTSCPFKNKTNVLSVFIRPVCPL